MSVEIEAGSLVSGNPITELEEKHQTRALSEGEQNVDKQRDKIFAEIAVLEDSEPITSQSEPAALGPLHATRALEVRLASALDIQGDGAFTARVLQDLETLARETPEPTRQLVEALEAQAPQGRLSIRSGEQWMMKDRTVEVNYGNTDMLMVCRDRNTGQYVLETAPTHISLAHEIIHGIHELEKGPDLYQEGLDAEDPVFDNREEFDTIGPLEGFHELGLNENVFREAAKMNLRLGHWGAERHALGSIFDQSLVLGQPLLTQERMQDAFDEKYKEPGNRTDFMRDMGKAIDHSMQGVLPFFTRQPLRKRTAGDITKLLTQACDKNSTPEFVKDFCLIFVKPRLEEFKTDQIERMQDIVAAKHLGIDLRAL